MTRWIGIHPPVSVKTGFLNTRDATLNCARETSNRQFSTARSRARAAPVGKPAIRGGAGREGPFENRLNTELLMSEPCTLDQPSHSFRAYANRIGGQSQGSTNPGHCVIPLLRSVEGSTVRL